MQMITQVAQAAEKRLRASGFEWDSSRIDTQPATDLTVVQFSNLRQLGSSGSTNLWRSVSGSLQLQPLGQWDMPVRRITPGKDPVLWRALGEGALSENHFDIEVSRTNSALRVF